MIYRFAVSVIIALAAVNQTAAELKIVGPATIPVGGMALLKLEGAKRGEPFDFFVAPTTTSLVVLFDADDVPVGVLNGQRAESLTVVGISFDAETKKLKRSLHTITVGAPQPDPPVPPDPTPPTPTPPVVEGKRALLIIRESADSTPALARTITALRNPPHSDYLKSKGHTLAVLDDDSMEPIVEKWRPLYAGLKLPALFVIDQNGNKLIGKPIELAPEATADDVMKALKANGG